MLSFLIFYLMITTGDYNSSADEILSKIKKY